MIAVSSYIVFSKMTIEEIFELVSKDFDGWEIVAEGVHTITSIRDELKRLIPSYDLKLTLHAPFSDINIGSFNERIRQEAVRQVVEAITIAAELEMEVVTVHPGFISPISLSKPEKVLEITRESVRHIDTQISGLGISVGMENMPEMIVTTCKNPDDLLFVIGDTSFGICFDVGHANTTGETENFLEHVDRFVNVHLHDNEGRGDQHLPIGAGNADFETVLKRLSEYSGTYVLETRALEDAYVGKRFLEKMLVN